jgi:hypothetical protein
MIDLGQSLPRRPRRVSFEPDHVDVYATSQQETLVDLQLDHRGTGIWSAGYRIAGQGCRIPVAFPHRVRGSDRNTLRSAIGVRWTRAVLSGMMGMTKDMMGMTKDGVP